MTRDDIIRMAKEAGLTLSSFCRWSAYSDDLERFAALVAAAEREACAVAGGAAAMAGLDHLQVAAAIRARSEQEQPQ